MVGRPTAMISVAPARMLTMVSIVTIALSIIVVDGRPAGDASGGPEGPRTLGTRRALHLGGMLELPAGGPPDGPPAR